jgi:formiminoglutamase
VVKTHTCWDVPVYRESPPPHLIEGLLDRDYHPYHAQLYHEISGEVRLCVDCHTMAATGPLIGPMAGEERPHGCLGDANGATLPRGWMDRLAECFRTTFGDSVCVNSPFAGGYITRTHGRRRPWLQLELSRGEFLDHDGQRWRVLMALTEFCRRSFS